MRSDDERQENERRARRARVSMPPDSVFYEKLVPGLLILLFLALLVVIGIIIVGQLGLFASNWPT